MIFPNAPVRIKETQTMYPVLNPLFTILYRYHPINATAIMRKVVRNNFPKISIPNAIPLFSVK